MKPNTNNEFELNIAADLRRWRTFLIVAEQGSLTRPCTSKKMMKISLVFARQSSKWSKLLFATFTPAMLLWDSNH